MDWETLFATTAPAPGVIDPMTGAPYVGMDPTAGVPYPPQGAPPGITPGVTTGPLPMPATPGVPYTSGAPSLGAALTPPAAPPLPTPAAVPTEPPAGPPMSIAPPAAAAAGQNRGTGLADVLRGVVAPKPPDVQKVGTPSLPAPRAVPPPKLLDLLRLYGLGGGAQPGQRPLTLGQALGGR